MKKLLHISYIFLIIPALLFLSRCTSGTSNNSNDLLALSQIHYVDIDPIQKKFTNSMGTGYEYYHVDIPEQTAGQNVSFDFTFNNTVGDPKDVYFIFSNISTSSSSTYPLINYSQDISQSVLGDSIASQPKALVSGSQIVKGKPEISEFNRNPYLYLNKINPINMLLSIVPATEPAYDSIGGSNSFQISSTSSVNAHCVRTNTDGNKTLNVWVADDCAGLSYFRSIADLADLFLSSGSNNDIYDWVTNIYGAEYGDTDWDKVAIDAKDVLITPNNEITILLMDIDNDKKTDKGVLGYFWAKDNFKKSAISYSNERIMIYMDAYFYASQPNEIISALAHELQHMIHFYQKTVIQTNGSGTETWIDEMCSMVTEDLVADKLGVDGPRGLTVGSAGLSGNTNGRLPLYNYYNDASVTSWYSGDYVAISYAVNYALGAYLARNYGGVKFFYNIMHNAYTDYRAIEYALQQGGVSDTFGIILAKWGVAGLLSSQTTADDGYQYNVGSWFTSKINPADTVTYNAGSINLYNYTYTYSTPHLSGPFVYNATNPMPTWAMPPASNEYYKAASKLTTSKTWSIKLRNNVRFTVLVK